jgi:hypothetical protein
MSREEDTLSARRNNVRINRVEGKIENSTGFEIYIETSNTVKLIPIFRLINVSRSHEGTGRISAIKMPITAKGIPTSPL